MQFQGRSDLPARPGHAAPREARRGSGPARDRMVRFLASPEEWRHVEEQAFSSGMSVSAFIRSCLGLERTSAASRTSAAALSAADAAEDEGRTPDVGGFSGDGARIDIRFSLVGEAARQLRSRARESGMRPSHLARDAAAAGLGPASGVRSWARMAPRELEATDGLLRQLKIIAGNLNATLQQVRLAARLRPEVDISGISASVSELADHRLPAVCERVEALVAGLWSDESSTLSELNDRLLKLRRHLGSSGQGDLGRSLELVRLLRPLVSHRGDTE